MSWYSLIAATKNDENASMGNKCPVNHYSTRNLGLLNKSAFRRLLPTGTTKFTRLQTLPAGIIKHTVATRHSWSQRDHDIQSPSDFRFAGESTYLIRVGSLNR